MKQGYVAGAAADDDDTIHAVCCISVCIYINKVYILYIYIRRAAQHVYTFARTFHYLFYPTRIHSSYYHCGSAPYPANINIKTIITKNNAISKVIEKWKKKIESHGQRKPWPHLLLHICACAKGGKLYSYAFPCVAYICVLISHYLHFNMEHNFLNFLSLCRSFASETASLLLTVWIRKLLNIVCTYLKKLSRNIP